MTTFTKIAELVNTMDSDINATAAMIRACVFDVDGTSNNEQQAWLDASTDEQVAQWCLPVLQAQAQQAD